MKKTIVALILVLATCLSMLAFSSCDKKKLDDFTIPDAGFDTETPVEITFYHTMGANLREVLDKYIIEFNKLYPNITIKYDSVGSYDDVRDQISTEMTAGNQPNIAYCYPDHVALYNTAKAVVTLDDLINNTNVVTRADGTTEILGLTAEQQADFIKGYYDEGKAFGDGKMYTLPLSKSTEVLYYNKTFFNQHGLKVPTTWDEMEETCRKIKEIEPDCIPLGYDSEANWFITMCEQSGSPYTSATGDKFLFDNETNREFVQRFRQWYQNGWLTTEELSGGYSSKLFTMDSAKEGNSYMSIGSTAGATYQRPAKTDGKYAFEVDIASIPQVNPADPKVISQGPSLCIFNDEDPQKVLASWLFVKYLCTTVEFQAEFSMVSGYMPVIKSATENEIYQTEFLDVADGGDNIQALSVKVAIAQQNAYFTSPAFYGSSEARDEVGSLMQKCFAEPINGDSNTVASKIKEFFEDAVEECEYKAG